MNGRGSKTQKGKGLIRALSRRGTRSDKSPPVAAKSAFHQPTVCERCGAVFSHKTWRQGRPITQTVLARAAWTTCPACTQASEIEYFGRVIIRGAFAGAHEEEIRRRLHNVAAQAASTQPQRRLISISRDNETLEVLTTSQKLAHRMVHELKKAFGGRASYAWSDRDGSLFAVWERNNTYTS